MRPVRDTAAVTAKGASVTTVPAGVFAAVAAAYLFGRIDPVEWLPFGCSKVA